MVRSDEPRTAPTSQAQPQSHGSIEEEYVSRAASKASLESSCAVFHRTLTGAVVEVICEHARTTRANLIVMTTHGRTGFSRAWLGSIADGVVRQSAVPVLMLRPEQLRVPAGNHSLRHFVVPLDGSEAAEAVLKPVLGLIGSATSALTLVQIVRPVLHYSAIPSQAYSVLMPIVDEEATQGQTEYATRYLEGLATKLRARTQARIEIRVVLEERVASAILALAKEGRADVIAMTTHGRGASRMIVGSVADKVLRGVATPFLLYRPPRQKSAVVPKLARQRKKSRK